MIASLLMDRKNGVFGLGLEFSLKSSLCEDNGKH
jgi:hypothetical protein